MGVSVGVGGMEVSVGVGGAFDYVVGSQSYAPSWIRKLNLEWLYRLFMQPWRVGRIITAFPYFPLHVFIGSLKYPKG